MLTEYQGWTFCIVDMSHKVLLLKDTRIPLPLDGYIGCNRITTIKTVRAKILTVGQVLKDDNRIPTNTYFGRTLYTRATKRNFFTARTIVSPQETVTVRQLNVGEEAKIIYRGTVIRLLSEVKVVETKAKT